MKNLLVGLLVLATIPLRVEKATAQSTTTMPRAVLQAGDVLKIDVWRKPELSGQFEVDADGHLKHPLYQEISLAGADMPEVTNRVRTFLKRFEAEPQFVLEPLLRVVVIGEVRQPGMFRLPRETTIAQAIASAGGPTEQANTEQSWLLREGKRIRIDPRGMSLSDQLQDRIQSGDQILIDRKVNLLRDIIAPTASVLAAVGVVINIIRK